MRYILITGARDYPDLMAAYHIVKDGLCQCGTILVHGNARGIDSIVGNQIAEDMRFDSQMFSNGSQVVKWPAQWTKFHKAAGPIRNQEMVNFMVKKRDEGNEVYCYAFPLEPRQKGSGTWDCIDKIKAAGLPVQIYPAKLVVAGKD